MNNNANSNDQRSLWDKIWKDRHGHIIIFQWPNKWLIAWAVLDVISLLAPRGGVERVSWLLGAVVLVIWSVIEFSKGVNYFRRGLGLVVLLLTVGSLFNIGF